jgi:hypothetical protein
VMPSVSGDADVADRCKVDPYRHVFASALFDSKRGTVGDVERAMARGIFHLVVTVRVPLYRRNSKV